MRGLFSFVLLAGLSAGQTMLEMSAGAAAGSVAGVAGKSVSGGLDRLKGLLGEAAKTGEKLAVPQEPPGQLSLVFDSPVAAVSGIRKAALASIQQGATRQELIAIAGAPSSRIVMGDGEHLSEVYTYRSGRETLGSVRLTDGSVTAVRVAGK